MSDTASLSKGWRVNLFLLLALLFFAAVLWWFDRQDTQRTQAEEASRVISTLLPDSVARIEFWRPGLGREEGSRVVMVPLEGGKEGPGGRRWQMVTPEKVRAHDAPINRLLDLLGKRYERKVAERVEDPAQFGLDKPAATLTVQDGAGVSLQLTLGLSAPASKNRYLQIGVDGPVVLVAPQVVGELLNDTDNLRDKRLFANQMVKSLSRVTRERPNEPPLTLSRTQDKPWQLLSPLADSASENRVGAWLNTLMQVNGNGFVAGKAEVALKERSPDWTLVVEHGEGERETVRIQRGESHLLAWREGEPDALKLDLSLAEELDKPVMELIALQPLADKSSTMLQLQVTHQGKTLTVAKKDGQWPKPVWTGIEDVLTRDAWRGVTPKPHGDAWLTIIVFQEQAQQVFHCWKEGETIVVAPPNRPLELELTHFQTKAFMDTVKALFPEE